MTQLRRWTVSQRRPGGSLPIAQQDKLEVFQEYIRDLEKAEEARKLKEKERQKRQERKSREAFVALLEQKRAEGKLTARSVWRHFEKEIEGEEAYLLMKGNLAGSRPKARPKARSTARAGGAGTELTCCLGCGRRILRERPARRIVTSRRA